ncbi:MAG: fimbrial assembly protein [Terracidiphilus sp.]|nr:fimbrial assembly protein [Terracidiphilus sp.]
MKITLNLATRPFNDLGPILKQLRIGMGVLAALAAIFALGLHFLHDQAEAARMRDHSLDGQITQIAAERQGYERLMQQPENAQLLTESSALNNLFAQKAFSWTLTMESLEKTLPAGVQALTLEPNREKDDRITVHVRVAGPRDRVVELVRNLEHSDRFRLPRIVGENAEQSSGFAQRQEPVSASSRYTFDILAEYVPPAPGERRMTQGKPEPGLEKPEAAVKKIVARKAPAKTAAGGAR